MLDLLVYLAVFAIIAIVVFWLFQQIPLPEPIRKIAMIVLVVVAVIILVGLLLNLTGAGPQMRWRL